MGSDWKDVRKKLDSCRNKRRKFLSDSRMIGFSSLLIGVYRIVKISKEKKCKMRRLSLIYKAIFTFISYLMDNLTFCILFYEKCL